MNETNSPHVITRLVTWFAALAAVIGGPAMLAGVGSAPASAEPVPARTAAAAPTQRVLTPTKFNPVTATATATATATVAAAVRVATRVTTPPPPPPPPPGDLAVWHAMSTLGTPYRYGGSSPGGFDCSGLVMWAWRQAGVSVPRTAGEQRRAAAPIGRADLRPGDLVFYRGTGHVGIFIGGDQVVHSPRSGKSVEVVPVDRGGMVASSYGRVK